MPASRESVDELFARLAASYGSQWLAKWDGMDMDKVAQVWQDELGGFKFRHIKYALENLPTDHPPTAMQFRALCRQAPEPAVRMLRDPERRPDPARIAEAIAKIGRGGSRHPMACAMELRNRELAGEKLNPAQRKHWRDVLGDQAQQTKGTEE